MKPNSYLSILATLLTLLLTNLSMAQQEPPARRANPGPQNEGFRDRIPPNRLIPPPPPVSNPDTPPAIPPAPANGGQCVIDIHGNGYRHTEIQRWEVTGPPVASAPGKLYPVQWSTSGTGSSHTSNGTQRRDATWTILAAQPVHFRALIRASDGKLLLQQSETQVRVVHGITGSQQVTISGTPQQPGILDSQASEFMYPAMVAPGNATEITETRQFPLAGALGFEQPGAATGTITCQWRFVL